MAIGSALRRKLWQATRLAEKIDSAGKLPADYQHTEAYRSGGFQGDVYAIGAGIENIDAGLVGMTDIGLVIAFRGTNGTFEDWMNNFLGELTAYPGGGRVHTGFWRSVQNVHTYLFEKAQELSAKYAPTALYLTGHSKGGAMATLTGSELCRLMRDKLPKPEVITFAAPRVGDKDYANAYPCKHTRFESCRDIVPHLPLTPQEGELMHCVFENFTGLFERYLTASMTQYAPLGTLEWIVPAGMGASYATSNAHGETLNALYYVMVELALKGRFSELGAYHTDDYIC